MRAAVGAWDGLYEICKSAEVTMNDKHISNTYLLALSVK